MHIPLGKTNSRNFEYIMVNNNMYTTTTEDLLLQWYRLFICLHNSKTVFL